MLMSTWKMRPSGRTSQKITGHFTSFKDTRDQNRIKGEERAEELSAMLCPGLGAGPETVISGKAEGMWMRPEDSVTVVSVCLREHPLLRIRGCVLAVLLPILSWRALCTPQGTCLAVVLVQIFSSRRNVAFTELKLLPKWKSLTFTRRKRNH